MPSLSQEINELLKKNKRDLPRNVLDDCKITWSDFAIQAFDQKCLVALDFSIKEFPDIVQIGMLERRSDIVEYVLDKHYPDR